MPGPFDSTTDPRPPPTGLAGTVAHNQIYQLAFDPQNMLAKRDFPDSDRFKLHKAAFCGVLQADDGFVPPLGLGLDPERVLVDKNPTGHSTALMVWTLADKGQYVIDVARLIGELLPLRKEGVADLIPGAVFHSHWAAVVGPAASYVLLTNEASGGGWALICKSEFEEVAANAPGPASTSGYKNYLERIHAFLCEPGIAASLPHQPPSNTAPWEV